ncbi:MAG: ADP-ribosylglycohydrolase family protein [Erysipelotrichaceae bacterium]|nr:ADP-ribosylglycohydrolase family protein [Erysipelotrichaceae bacterium]
MKEVLTDRQGRIYGSLLGAAVGDSMGAISEGFSPEFLKQRYNGYLTDLLQPTDDGMTVDSHPGMVSDDFSVAYYTAEVMLENHRMMDHDMAVKGLLRWWEHPEYTVYCGPSSRNGIMKLIDPDKAVSHTSNLKCLNGLVTNGGAMKSGIMGVFNAGDVDQAISDTITMCRITHTNAPALAAACAVSAAAAKAFDNDVTYLDLINAGIYGSEKGYELSASFADPVCAPDVVSKIRWAVEIGLSHQDDFETTMIELADTIGSGLWAYEAIPCAFGMIAACKGDLLKGLYMAVNAGQDADSTACMIGYILGAMHGYSVIPERFRKLIDEANGFDLRKMAIEITKLQEGVKDE